MVQRFSLTLLLSTLALVAACSSGVKLNETPVIDKSTSSTAAGAGASGASQSGVTPVDLNASAANAAGPAGLARTVYFDFDSYVVGADYQAIVDGHARFLKANPRRNVVLQGHTDDAGGREYNLALGQRRAEAVRRSMGLLGVADSQIEAVSFGKEKPAVAGTDENARAQNRRAEIAYR